MRRGIEILFCVLSLFACVQAYAGGLEATEREENEIWLNGNVLPSKGFPRIEFTGANAMVCGMKHRDSYLSVREAPDIRSKELYRAAYYTIMALTGNLADGGNWAEIRGVRITHDTHARRLEEEQIIDIRGWAATKYLCDFVD